MLNGKIHYYISIIYYVMSMVLVYNKLTNTDVRLIMKLQLALERERRYDKFELVIIVNVVYTTISMTIILSMIKCAVLIIFN